MVLFFLLSFLFCMVLVSSTYVSPHLQFVDLAEYSNEDIQSDTSIVFTESGYVQGELLDTSRSFRKIPFAAPPVNQSRWKAPEPPASWNGQVLQAIGDPAGCPQTPSIWWEAPVIQDEDCLYLNVYTPINDTVTGSEPINNNTLLPVMMWIHGGEFLAGYGGAYIYNGTNLVNLTNVIVVTINYRLGVLGYFWHPDLGFAGNYGIQDQMLALQWIRKNIKYFGGDPNQITIFGQSAGAISVALLMMIDDIKDDFVHGIWHSEPLGIPLRSPKTWGDIPSDFVYLANCTRSNTADTLTCLYDIPPKEIINLQNQIDSSIIQGAHFLDAFLPWTPTIGNGLFADQPLWAYQQGYFTDNNKPLIAGSVRNEGQLFVYGVFTNGLDFDTMILLMYLILQTESNVQRVLKQYPLPTNTTDYRAYASNIVTDGMFHCPTRNVTASLSTRSENNGDIFLYHFNHLPSFSTVIWGDQHDPECYENVCHGDDIPFIFRVDGASLNASYLPSETLLSETMESYWGVFGWNGNPYNGQTFKYDNGSVVFWKQFNTDTQETMIFQTNDVQLVSNYDKSKCELWDEIGYPWLPVV